MIKYIIAKVNNTVNVVAVVTKLSFLNMKCFNSVVHINSTKFKPTIFITFDCSS